MGRAGLGVSILVRYLLALGWLVWGTTAQVVSVALTSSRVAYQPIYLRDYLVDPSVNHISLAANVVFNSTNWLVEGTAVIGDREIIISPLVEGSWPTINFGGRASLLLLGPGSKLTFSHVILNNTASLVLDPDNKLATRRAVGFSLWPTILMEPNSTVVFNNTITYFYSQETFTACRNYRTKVAASYNDAFGANATVAVGDTGLRLTGTHVFPTPIVDSEFGGAGVTVGSATIISINATAICVDGGPVSFDHPIVTSAAPKSKFRWFYALTLGLGVALIILLTAIIIYLCRTNKRMRLQTRSLIRRKSRLKSADVEVPMEIAKPDSGGDDMGPASDARGSNCSAASEPGGDFPSQDKETSRQVSFRRSMESSRGLSSGSSAVQPRLSMPDLATLLRSRSADVLGNVEMGPLLGRGAFGRVYKAKWNGVFVAVKVVEHTAETGSMLNTLRESALSQSITHPNVVTTYKIITIRTENNGETTKVVDGVDASSMNDRLPDVGDGGGTALQSDSAQTSKGLTPSTKMSANRIQHQVVDTGHGEFAVVPYTSQGQDSPQRSEDSFKAHVDVQETWMILEFCDKGTLEQAISGGRFKARSTGQCDMLAVLASLKDIASGMEYLHSLGVLHGDLKPANVMLKSVVYDARHYICKLADFGLSRVLGDLATHVSTRTYGTISFMPPELIRDAKLSKAADVYSYGILMWETYFSRTAYEGVPAATVFYMVAVENRRPVVTSDMPSMYRELMEECWDSDPEKRPPFTEVLRRITAMWEAARLERQAAKAAAGEKGGAAGATTAEIGNEAGKGSPSSARTARARQLRRIASMNRGGPPAKRPPTPIPESPIGPPNTLARFSLTNLRHTLTRKSLKTGGSGSGTLPEDAVVVGPPSRDASGRAPSPVPEISAQSPSVAEPARTGSGAWQFGGDESDVPRASFDAPGGEAFLSSSTVRSEPASIDQKDQVVVVPPEAIASSGWATAKLRSLSSSKRGQEGSADAAVAEFDENAKDHEGDIPAVEDAEGQGVTEARVCRVGSAVLDIERTLEAKVLVTTSRSRGSTPPEGARRGPSRPGSASSPSATANNGEPRDAELGSPSASRPPPRPEDASARVREPSSVPSMVVAHQGSTSSLSSTLSEKLLAPNSPGETRQRRGMSREMSVTLESPEEDTVFSIASTSVLASPFAVSPPADRPPRNVRASIASAFAEDPAPSPAADVGAPAPRTNFISPFAMDAASPVRPRANSVTFALPDDMEASGTGGASPFAQSNAGDAARGPSSTAADARDAGQVNTGTSSSRPSAESATRVARGGSPSAGPGAPAATGGSFFSPFANVRAPPASGGASDPSHADSRGHPASDGPVSSPFAASNARAAHGGPVSSPFADV